jgi:small-conductance mechanosensitive channel
MDDQSLQTIAQQFFNIDRILVAVGIFALTWGAVWLLRRGSDLLAAKFGRYRLQISSFYPVLRLGIWVGSIAFILVVVFNPPMSTLLPVGASAGLALGLGAQDLIKNVIAGVVILFDRPFRGGDMVQVGEHYGEVVNIGLRSIRLRTFDDSEVTLPNALVLGQAVSNSNSGALDEMVVAEFHLPASVDVQEVKHLAWEAAACSPYVYLKKPVNVLVEDVFDYTFLTRFKVKAYVLDIRYERLFASDVLERIKQEIVARGLLTPGQLEPWATPPAPPAA